MSEIRIYELARELAVKSKDLVERCRDEGIEVKSHMSSISNEHAEKFRQEFSGAGPKPEKEAPEPKPEPAPKAKAPSRPKDKSKTRKPDAPKKVEARSEEPKPIQEVQPSSDPGPGDQIQRGSHQSYKLKPGGYERSRGPIRPQRGSRRGRGRPKSRQLTPQDTGPEKGQKFTVTLPVTVRDLSTILGVKQNNIIRDLMKHEVLATINHELDEEQIVQLSVEYEIEIEIAEEEKLEDRVLAEFDQEDSPENLEARAPVVTFLGHVDHGKTSLLDKILDTNVVDMESGGITQHIGAHSITHGDSKVVFLDTPGHKAFTAMRARGANVTDIVVLVVAADDGIMPQTEEAIDHARAAEVPIVVALNKIDLPNAQPERVLQQLSGRGIQPEEWGGDSIVVRTSAITGDGVEELVEMLALQAEILELKANPNKKAVGTILESKLSEGRGVETTVLVHEGTLHRGEVLIAGNAYGKIRGIFDDKDRLLRSVGPSTPVKLIGFTENPEIGSKFYVVKDLQTARSVVGDRARRASEASQVTRTHVTLETLSAHLSASETKEARFVVKTDVQGSLEVLNKAILDFTNELVTTRILHHGVGGINESDVLLADASDAIIIGFNVVPDDRARSLADDRKISIRVYQVIYMAIEEIKDALEGMLDPEEEEHVTGSAEIRQIFSVSRSGNIAGCIVRDGNILRSSRIRLIRDGVIIHQGRLSSLRRHKDDVREVRDGLECGIKIEGYDDVKVGDTIQAFTIELIARKLSPVTS